MQLHCTGAANTACQQLADNQISRQRATPTSLKLATCYRSASPTQFSRIRMSFAAVKPIVHQEEMCYLGVSSDVGAVANGCRYQLLSSIDAL